MNTSDLKPSEYHKFYEPYIFGLGDVDLLEMLSNQLVNFPKFIGSIAEDKLNFAYADGKWTIAEALVHVLDAERVFQYRALRFARMDTTPLAGFDQDNYVPVSNANNRTKQDLINEYQIVRKSSIALFSTFDEEVLKRVGVANKSEMSVAALGFIICGHQKHHRNIIRERYL